MRLADVVVPQPKLLAGLFDPFLVLGELFGHDEAFGVVGVGLGVEGVEVAEDIVKAFVDRIEASFHLIEASVHVVEELVNSSWFIAAAYDAGPGRCEALENTTAKWPSATPHLWAPHASARYASTCMSLHWPPSR